MLPSFNLLFIQAVFNILILVVVWPWVYIAYRRVLTNLRAKYRGQEVRRENTNTRTHVVVAMYFVYSCWLVVVVV